MSSNVMMLSRSVKRVPLDFDWPIDKTWDGYLPAPARKCPAEDCDNGQTIARAWVERAASLLLLAADAPMKGELHPWLQEIALQPGVPQENIRELTNGLAGRPWRGPFGHDAIDRYVATKAILRGAGLSEDWGICEVCKGHAMHPDDIAAQEDWTPTEPPAGPGFQMWESVSGGSPISPVFDAPAPLARWLAEHPSGITDRFDYGVWLAVIDGQIVGTSIPGSRPVSLPPTQQNNPSSRGEV